MARYTLKYEMTSKIESEEDALRVLGDLKMLFEAVSQRYLVWSTSGKPVSNFVAFAKVATSPRPRVFLERAYIGQLGIEARLDIDLNAVQRALDGWDVKVTDTCGGCSGFRMAWAKPPAQGMEPHCDYNGDLDKGYNGDCKRFTPVISGVKEQRARPLSVLVQIADDTPSIYLAAGLLREST